MTLVDSSLVMFSLLSFRKDLQKGGYDSWVSARLKLERLFGLWSWIDFGTEYLEN